MKVHVNMSYNTYLFAGHFCSICYIAKLNVEPYLHNVIQKSPKNITSSKKITANAFRSLQKHWPSPSTIKTCTATLPHKPHSILHLPWLSYHGSYPLTTCITRFCQSMHKQQRELHAGMSFLFQAQQQKLGLRMLILTFLQ